MRTLCSKQIRYASIEGKPDAFGKTKKIGEIYFVNASSWASVIKDEVLEAYNAHRWRIRKAGISPPIEYFTVEKFSEKTIAEYVEKKKEIKSETKCKTETNTLLSGSIQFDLEF